MENKIIIYNTDDGKSSVKLFAQDGTVWLNQQLMAELFDTSKQSISYHIVNILKEGELHTNSVVKEFLTTAAELVVSRADANTVNMALTSWKGKIVRKQDIYTAKNYLSEDEIDTLNRLVVIFLETAELQAKGRKDLTMKFWRENVDGIITYNKKKLLTDAGNVSNKQMEMIVDKVYDEFNEKRKKHELEQADKEDLEELKQIEKELKKR